MHFIFTADTSLKNAILRMVVAGYQQLHTLIPNLIMQLCQGCSREPRMSSACARKIYRVALNH